MRINRLGVRAMDISTERTGTGLLGGTFDPVHNGHLWIARTAMQRLSLSRVIMMPAGVPPHKDPAGASPVHRVAMLRLAVDGLQGVEVSELELARPGKSYTADTLETLAALCPGERLYLLCGADMFLTLQDWYRCERIFELCTVVGMARSGGQRESLAAHAELLRERYGARACILDEEPLELSSTDIRRRIAENSSTEGLLPEVVRAYIDREGLYRNTPARREEPV